MMWRCRRRGWESAISNRRNIVRIRALPGFVKKPSTKFQSKDATLQPSKQKVPSKQFHYSNRKALPLPTRRAGGISIPYLERLIDHAPGLLVYAAAHG